MTDPPTPDPDAPAADPLRAAAAVIVTTLPADTRPVVGLPWPLLIELLVPVLGALLRRCVDDGNDTPESLRRAARRLQRPLLGAFGRMRLRRAMRQELERGADAVFAAGGPPSDDLVDALADGAIGLAAGADGGRLGEVMRQAGAGVKPW
jgi:hypothetical protein